MNNDIIRKICVACALLMSLSAAVMAKPTSTTQTVINFLDETVVFCDSRQSLVTYKNMADVFDMEGLNEIVLAGECDFVPDGKFLSLQDYECYDIKSTGIVAAEVQGTTVWTFNKLVSRGDPESLHGTFGGHNIDDIVDIAAIDRRKLSCPNS